ncbi:MAG: leucyl aminopeptidase family protein, partial [Roseicyclus sp.]
MPLTFAAPDDGAINIQLITPDGCDAALAALPETQRAWAFHHGFAGALAQTCTLPNPEGSPARVLIGTGTPADRLKKRFAIGAAIAGLPGATYRLAEALAGQDGAEIALGYLLSLYRFDRYRLQPAAAARLVAPDGIDAARLEHIAAGEALTRDLINTPAENMGPDALEAAIRELALGFEASVTATEGDDLLKRNFPLIHTVGRAGARAPRLLEMKWGSTGPTLTLVGKGV